MRKFTYINKKTGQREYSNVPVFNPDLELVKEIKGSVPVSIQKFSTRKNKQVKT